MLFLSSPRAAAALTNASCLAPHPAGAWGEGAAGVVIEVGLVEGIVIVLVW